VQRENIGKLRSRGLELIADAALGKSWTGEFGYVYTDATVTENTDDPDIVGNRGEGVSEHAVTAGLGRTPQRGIGFFVQARWLGEQYQDISNEALLPSHFLMDASVTYNRGPGWELFAEGKNLLDEEYTVQGGEQVILGPSRQLFAGVRVRLRR
jgi:outer membrane receptor protein involved in Fe transport